MIQCKYQVCRWWTEVISCKWVWLNQFIQCRCKTITMWLLHLSILIYRSEDLQVICQLLDRLEVNLVLWQLWSGILWMPWVMGLIQWISIDSLCSQLFILNLAYNKHHCFHLGQTKISKTNKITTWIRTTQVLRSIRTLWTKWINKN